MKRFLQPWQLLLTGLTGWVNQRQQAKIEYLETEVRVLRDEIGKRRLLLDDATSRLSSSAFAVGADR